MDALAQLQPHLRPGEQLLWYGNPDPRVWFAPTDAFMIPFSILWCAFAIFWEANAARSGPLFTVLWGIPFIAFGLYFVFGRFIYKRYRKKLTAYGITADRALIATPRSVADTSLRHQAVTVRRTRDFRHASVLIATTPTHGRGVRPGQSSSWFYANTGLDAFARNTGLPFAFYDVADPEAMLHALEQARSQPAA